MNWKYKILLLLVILVLLLPLLAYFVLQNGHVQEYLTNRITRQVSEQLDTKFRIEGVDIRLFRSVVLEEVYLEDRENDTLLYAEKLDAQIEYLRPLRKQIKLDKILLKSPKLRMREDSMRRNFDFVLEALAGDTTQQKKPDNAFSIQCNDFELTNAQISYQSPLHDSISDFDLKNFRITDISTEISNIEIGDTTRLEVNNFSLENHETPSVNNLLFKAEIAPGTKAIHDLILLTDHSNLLIKEFRWQQHNDSNKGFWQNNRFYAEIGEGSFIAGGEVAQLLPDTLPRPQNIELSGTFSSDTDSLYAHKLKLLYGGANILALHGRVKGLDSMHTLSGDITVEQLLLQSRDVLNTLSAFLPDSTMKTIRGLEETRFMQFSGRLNGNFTDVKLKGKLRTSEGNLTANMQVQRNKSGSIKAIDGTLDINNLNPRPFINNPDLGKLTLTSEFSNLKLQKRNSTGNFTLHLKNAGYKGQSFEDLHVNGSLNGQKIHLQASMADTAVRFKLNSQVFMNDLPTYRFSLRVGGINFAQTGIDQNADSSELKFNMNAYLKGKSLENISGTVQLSNAEFRRDTSRLHLEKLTLDARQSAFKQKSLTLKSPFCDAKIHGKFDYKRLPQTFMRYLHGIFPRAIAKKSPEYEIAEAEQEVRYSFKFKKINSLLSIFRLNSSISPGTSITGSFNNLAQQLKVEMQSRKLVVFGNHISDLNLNGSGQDNTLKFDLKTQYFKVGNRAKFHQLGIDMLVQNDSIRLQSQWNNSEEASSEYKGAIKTTAYFREIKDVKALNFKVNLHPSYFVIADTLWRIHPTTINIDSAKIAINEFQIKNKEELIAIEGWLSSNPKDTLHLDFKNFQMGNLNILLQETDFSFGGLLNGQFALNNVFDKPFVQMQYRIKDLNLNNNLLGNMHMEGGYTAQKGIMNLNMEIQEKNIKNFVLKGSYRVPEDSLNFDLYMKNLSLNMFNPLLEGTISDVAGLASTQNLSLTGSTTKPIITGSMFLQKAGFRIDYLNTRYTFTDSVQFTKKRIHFRDFQLHDNRNNKALVQGYINHNYYKDFNFNLKASLENFQALNTTSQHNEQFYGEAYTSGIINLTGSVNDLVINVSARTEEKTRFFIPLSSGSEINESKFITFASDTGAQALHNAISHDIETDISGIQMSFDLEVTPEASISLILNEATGDVLHARGNGALRLAIDTRGLFNMYGDYNIQEGNYVFSLQNMVTRKFDIEQGSSIKWDGNPYNAQLDITTTYTVNDALLYDLTLQDMYKETRVPAQCVIELEDDLTNPTIDFKVGIAEAYQGLAETDQIEAQLENLPQEELNKQFLSLLIINRFQPLPGFSSAQSNLASNTNVGLSNSASEMLTNRLSNWISEISDDFNVGINYNTSDSISSSELEVALSTQLLNDRVRINGNLSMGDEYNNPENYFGNFDVEYKITKNGKLRVKYYNKANNDLVYNEAPNKQGLGLFYQEDFDTFSSLIKRYKQGFMHFWNNLWNKDEEEEK